jgi:dTDP-4-amino-4,6-dideoxygalactose transaminase
VEDAAQAMGGMVRGKKLGTLGDVGFFSLGRGKNITCGSGGIIITNSEPIAAAIEKEYAGLEQPGLAENLTELFKAILLSLFIRPGLYWLPANLPFLKLGSTIFYRDFPVKKLSGMQAGLLRNWEKKLTLSNRIRQENARYLCRRLDLGLCNELPSLLRLPLLAENRRIRNSITRLSRERGMGISRMYPSPINRIEELKDQFHGKSFPAANSVAERLLTLPTHELLTKKDRRSIIRFIIGIDSHHTPEKAHGAIERFSVPDMSSYK